MIDYGYHVVQPVSAVGPLLNGRLSDESSRARGMIGSTSPPTTRYRCVRMPMTLSLHESLVALAWIRHSNLELYRSQGAGPAPKPPR